MTWYVRPSAVVAMGQGDRFVFLVPGRAPISIDGLDTSAMSSVLTAAGRPIARDALLEHCDDVTIDKLVELGVLAAGDGVPPELERPRGPKPCKRLVVAVSGAIRATTFLGHLATLADVFADEVDVIVSAKARKFMRSEVYAYHGMRVWTDAYKPAHGEAVPHRFLAKADLVLVAPASAATIHRLATGACDDLASLVVALTESPVVVVPSMHPNMWAHPPIARNVDRLREDGVWVIEPGLGFSAGDPGDRGVGAATLEAEHLVRALAVVMHSNAPG